jgi:hypothetical protein
MSIFPLSFPPLMIVCLRFPRVFFFFLFVYARLDYNPQMLFLEA